MVQSLLDVINEVDSFRLNDTYYKLLTHDAGAVLGYIAPFVAQFFQHTPSFEFDGDAKTIKIGSEYDSFEKRNALFKILVINGDSILSFTNCLIKVGEMSCTLSIIRAVSHTC